MRTAINNNEDVKGAMQSNRNATQRLGNLFTVGFKDIYWSAIILTEILSKMLKNAISPQLVNSLKAQL